MYAQEGFGEAATATSISGGCKNGQNTKIFCRLCARSAPSDAGRRPSLLGMPRAARGCARSSGSIIVQYRACHHAKIYWYLQALVAAPLPPLDAHPAMPAIQGGLCYIWAHRLRGYATADRTSDGQVMDMAEMAFHAQDLLSRRMFDKYGKLKAAFMARDRAGPWAFALCGRRPGANRRRCDSALPLQAPQLSPAGA